MFAGCVGECLKLNGGKIGSSCWHGSFRTDYDLEIYSPSCTVSREVHYEDRLSPIVVPGHERPAWLGAATIWLRIQQS